MTFPSLGETYEKQPAGLRVFNGPYCSGVNNTTLDKERLKTEKQIREESIESTLNPEGVKRKTFAPIQQLHQIRQRRKSYWGVSGKWAMQNSMLSWEK